MSRSTETALLDGEFSIYPGHPIVIAWIIINTFDSWTTATAKREGAQYCEALSNAEIPGAGGNVYAAIDLLSNIFKGVSYDAAFECASEWWASCDSQMTCNPRRWEEGQDQADRVLERFAAKIATWPV